VPGYEIQARLGQGGMGAVYRARRRADDGAVALKLLPPRLGGDPEFVARFVREARAAAALRHPNIVEGLDAGCADDHYYVAMELVEGESLDARLRRTGALPESEVVAIGLAVARALDYAHGQGLVHRDVKPGNVLLAQGFAANGAPDPGAVKLCDLGLAKWVGDGGTAVTQTGIAVGTPQYVAPEQALGRADVDIRADLYALGATLYHAATGRAPFTGGSGADVALRRLVADPEPPRSVNPRCSPGLAALIERLLARAPADRPATPATVARDLEALQRGESPTDPPRRPVGVGALAAVAGALAVGALVLALGPPGPAPATPPAPAGGPPRDAPDGPAALEAEIAEARAELERLAAMQDELDRLLAAAAAGGRLAELPPEQLAAMLRLSRAMAGLRARLTGLADQADRADRLRRDLERPTGP
jgi:serine/threonine-protein kinase